MASDGCETARGTGLLDSRRQTGASGLGACDEHGVRVEGAGIAQVMSKLKCVKTQAVAERRRHFWSASGLVWRWGARGDV